MYSPQFHYPQKKLMKYSGDYIRFNFRGTNVSFHYNGDVRIGNPNAGTVDVYYSITSPYKFAFIMGGTISHYTGKTVVPPGGSKTVGKFADESIYTTRVVRVEVLSVRYGNLANTMSRAIFEILLTRKDSAGKYWAQTISPSGTKRKASIFRIPTRLRS